MQIKKLVFAPLFLSLILTLTYLFKLALDKNIEIFFGPWGGFYELGLVAIAIFLTSITYCIYIALSENVKYYLIPAVLGSLTPFIFLSPSLAIIAGIGFFVSSSITYFNLMTSLRTYINFQPSSLLSPPIKTFGVLFSLSLSIVFYFYSNAVIQTQGFKLPEPIVDWAIDLSLKGSGVPVKGEKYLAQIPTLSQEQIDLLKSKPELLRQYGISAKDLDQLNPSDIKPDNSAAKVVPSLPQTNIKDIVKAQITDTLDQIIKPYLFAIPIILAFLFYSITTFVLWILSFLLNPLILLIFYVFEKTGFVKFEKEMREVRKIIV